MSVPIQTINHDHMILTHMFNVARSLVRDNPVSCAEAESSERLKVTLVPHLPRLLTVAYDVGPRRGERLHLEWSDVNMHRKEFNIAKRRMAGFELFR